MMRNLIELTFTLASWWMVERQTQGNDSSNFQNYECDVLQCLPHQLQERFSFLRWNKVFPKCCVTFLQIYRVSRQTCRHKKKTFIIYTNIEMLHKIIFFLESYIYTINNKIIN